MSRSVKRNKKIAKLLVVFAVVLIYCAYVNNYLNLRQFSFIPGVLGSLFILAFSLISSIKKEPIEVDLTKDQTVQGTVSVKTQTEDK